MPCWSNVIRRAASPVLAALICLVLLRPALAQPTERRVALVIGNATYQSLPQLANPANDARLVAETLKGLGFVLIGGGAQIDLDKAGFDRAIQSLGQELQNADVGLFYYAGHGLQVQGTNWLVPVEANPVAQRDLDFQMEDADRVLKQMQYAKTRLNVIILDACRNNPFRGAGVRAAGGGLAEMRAPEGTLIAYSTQPGSVAHDGAGANSPFSAALARTLREPGLDVFRVFNSVGLAVKRDTAGEQQPWMSSSPIDGEFYFSGVGPNGAPVVATDPDLLFWRSIAAGADPAEYKAYLQQFPNGRFAELARTRSGLAEPSPQAPANGTLSGALLALLQPPRTEQRPEPGRIARDEQTVLFNASARSLRWLRGPVLRSYQSYVQQFDPERGPTGKERDASFFWSIDSRAAPALDSLKRVLAGGGPDDADATGFTELNEAPFGIQPPAPAAIPAAAGLDSLRLLAQRYAEAADALLAAAAPVAVYYGQGDFRDDGFAKGRAMHKRLMAAYRDFLPAAEALQDALARLAPDARERYLRELGLERRQSEAARMETLKRARDLVRYYVAAVRESSKTRALSAPGMGARIDLVEQSYAEFERSRPKPATGIADASGIYALAYQRFLRAAKELWRSQRDGSGGALFIAETQGDLVSQFNSMVFTAAQER